jgi:hypothetical protein
MRLSIKVLDSLKIEKRIGSLLVVALICHCHALKLRSSPFCQSVGKKDVQKDGYKLQHKELPSKESAKDDNYHG